MHTAPAVAPSLKRSAAHTVAWTVLGYGAMHIARFGFNLILARLLAPEDFGLMALVMVVVQSVHMFSDIGVMTCVIQSKRGDDDCFLNTAWTVQIIRGAGMFLGTCVLAFPAASIYAEPQLLWLIPAVGITALIDGFDSTATYTLRRHLQNGRLMALEFGSYFVSMLIAVACCWVMPGVWALVLGTVLQQVLSTVLSFIVLPRRPHRWQLEPDARRELSGFGRWVFVSTIATFLAGQADRFILAALVGFELLGIYHISASLVAIPGFVLIALSDRLTMPLATRVHHGQLRPEALGDVHRLTTLASGVATSGVIALGPILASVLYDSRYHDATWMIPLLAAGAWLRLLQCTPNAVLLGSGRSRRVAASNIAKLVVMPGLIAGGWVAFGMQGLLIGLALAEGAKYVVMIINCRNDSPGTNIAAAARTDLAASVTLAAAWTASAVVGAAMQSSSVWTHITLQAAQAVACWTPLTYAWAWPRVRAMVANRWAGPTPLPAPTAS